MLVVHRSERADLLVEALGDLLLHTPHDPMQAEVIAVPTRGVERWLTQRLSHRLGATGAADGVCANVEFPFPGALVNEATAAVCGIGADADPWPPHRSVWPLIEVVDQCATEPWLRPLVAHLEAGSPGAVDGSSGLRRFATVRHVADLYDRYSVHRPELVQSWAQGADGERDAAAGSAVGASAAAVWQSELWRRLRDRIGVASPAERLSVAAARLSEEPELLDLPATLSLFGLTSLPASHLRVLEAIGCRRDVHLFLLHPSGALWQAVEAHVGDSLSRPPKRGEDPTVTSAVNPLLRSWGRDAREMQLVLRASDATAGEHLPVPAATSTALTLLERLQHDVRANRPPGAVRPDGGEGLPILDDGDDSVRVHACHGRLRQVEVMRDAILHLLAADPTLEPRDVLVMCPDIESFAPLVHAVFGAATSASAIGGDHAGPAPPGPPQIRVRLADRSIRQTNPLLAVAAQLLELAFGRVSASEVLDLATRDSVARRFRFDESELGQLERWVVETGIRWGLDRGHRERWRLGGVGDNTWEAGLDRLLLGVAMSEDGQRLFNGLLPLDDVSSSALDLAGRFAELVERLHQAVAALQGPQTIRTWVDVLVEATERLALAAPHELWQHDQLRWVLGDVVTEATPPDCADLAKGCSGAGAGSPSEALLDLAEVRALLDGRLRGRPTRANFRTGDLTICTLVPMRSVPHRVVGLLGLDDGAFPRDVGFDGDDLLLADPRVGDRDARSEDRQLLLDALLAATEHLVVTYEGRDPRTNLERSPCVPVGELLDVVDGTVRPPEGSPHRRAREHVVVEHPLQSFDPRNFAAGQLAGHEPWSFDPVDLAGARAHAGPPLERRPFLARPLPRLDDHVVQLESLVRFLEHPVAAFLRERLGWYGRRGSDRVKDSLPLSLDDLETWGVGHRVLAALLAGATPEQARRAEEGRGLLPPGAMGGEKLREIEDVARLLADAARAAASGTDPRSVEVHVALHDGATLIGTVPDVHAVPSAGGGEPELRIVRCLYSTLAPKHRLVAWARLLALSAARPVHRVSAVTIGRAPTKSKGVRIALARLPAFEGAAAERRELALGALGVLVDLYGRGMSEPLPLFAKTSEQLVDALRKDRTSKKECAHVWEAQGPVPGEADDAAHVLVFGEKVRFSDLLGLEAHDDESGPGWSRASSRVERLARRLWEPLLCYEESEYRS